MSQESLLLVSPTVNVEFFRLVPSVCGTLPNIVELGYILKGGHHLLGLINEVLGIVRVETGHIELSLLVEECCSLVRPLAQENDIQMIADVDHPEIYVMADRQRLQQIVLNLLSNAIKYNQPQGQVTLSVRQGQSGHIQLRVTDTGHGLAPQQVQQVFTPFERLHAANSSIGSTFWIELPGAASPLAGTDEAPPLGAPAQLPASQQTYTVLSIEDN